MHVESTLVRLTNYTTSHNSSYQLCIGIFTITAKVTGLTSDPVSVDGNMLKQTVRWMPPENINMSVITGYTLRYKTDLENGTEDAIRVGKNQTFAEIVLEKPTGRITYYVTVSADSSEGEGPPSEQLNITYKRKYECSH